MRRGKDHFCNQEVEVAWFSNDSALCLRIRDHPWQRTLDAVSFNVGEDEENGVNESGCGNQGTYGSFVEEIIEDNFSDFSKFIPSSVFFFSLVSGERYPIIRSALRALPSDD